MVSPRHFVSAAATLVLFASCASPTVSMHESGKPEVQITQSNLLPKALLSQYTLTAQDVVRVSFIFGKGEYHILPGDEISVNFNNVGLTNQTIVVRPDGRITLPDNGELTAAGLTPIELGHQIDAAYQSKVIHPLQVSVSLVKASGSPATDLNGEYTIRPDGILALPYLGEIPAGGRTTREVAEDLSAAAAKQFHNNFEAYLIVKNFAGSIFVGGEVVKPGSYPYVGGLTTLKSVLLAGGFTEDADQNGVFLIHYKTNRDVIVYRTSLKTVYGQASGLNDLVLSPQDVVYVPKTGVADADMFVDQYVNKIIPHSTNLTYSLTSNVAPVIH